MNFRDSVFREYHGRYVDDPAQLCLALRSPQDAPGMSLYHQLVKKEGIADFIPQQVHVIASPDSVGRALSDFHRDFSADLEIVGQTYAVKPYTLGFARFGEKDMKKRDDTLDYLTRAEPFLTYVKHWLETPEGHETMLQDISKQFQVPADYIEEQWKTKTEDELEIITCCYLCDHIYDPGLAEYQAFQQSRLQEYRNETRVIADDDLGSWIEAFYDLSAKDETAMRLEQAADYKKSKRLLRNLTYA